MLNDAFSWLDSKLLLAKLCLFVIGSTFAASHRQFFVVYAAAVFVTSFFRFSSVGGREGNSQLKKAHLVAFLMHNVGNLLALF